MAGATRIDINVVKHLSEMQVPYNLVVEPNASLHIYHIIALWNLCEDKEFKILIISLSVELPFRTLLCLLINCCPHKRRNLKTSRNLVNIFENIIIVRLKNAIRQNMFPKNPITATEWLEAKTL